MIGEIWIQANMTEDGTVHLLVAPGIAVKCTFEEESQ